MLSCCPGDGISKYGQIETIWKHNNNNRDCNNKNKSFRVSRVSQPVFAAGRLVVVGLEVLGADLLHSLKCLRTSRDLTL